MATHRQMKRAKLSPLEKAICKKIEKTKSKAARPGYLRELVAKLHPKIEAALARGCEYDDLAQSISETGVKISSATLKQYHTEYRRKLRREKNQSDNSSELSKESEPAVEIEKRIEQASNWPLPTQQPPEVNAQVNPESAQPDRKQSAIDRLFVNK